MRRLLALLLLAAAPAWAAQRGTGFRVKDGAPTGFENQSGAVRGNATFNNAFDPFTPDGDAENQAVLGGNQFSDALERLWAGRYYGGDMEKFYTMRRAQGAWGEHLSANAIALERAFKDRSIKLPDGGYWASGDWDGTATWREQHDLAYVITRRDPFYMAGYVSQAGDGRSPETPMKVFATACDAHFKGLPYRYVVTVEAGGAPAYFDLEACRPTGEISYSPASETQIGGRRVKVPAYPQVFGPPTASEPPPPPPSPPPPPPPPPPVCESLSVQILKILRAASGNCSGDCSNWTVGSLFGFGKRSDLRKVWAAIEAHQRTCHPPAPSTGRLELKIREEPEGPPVVTRARGLDLSCLDFVCLPGLP